MPRISPRDWFKARAINNALFVLLPICRDLNSARNEFRWMQEHAVDVSRRAGQHDHRPLLKSFVTRRSRGEPLQYLLESGYFGDLEIKCRPGVLIPRPETAASVSYLANSIRPELNNEQDQHPRPIRVLDLCTGTGCIPLLFHHEFYASKRHVHDSLELVGIDISPSALALARENLIHQIANQAAEQSGPVERTKSLHSIGFVQADVLHKDGLEVLENGTGNSVALSVMQALGRVSSDWPPAFDILLSNPPYISPTAFRQTTSRSVRQFEPKLALVPPATTDGMSDTEIGDVFYPELFSISEAVNAQVCLFEVADMDQATRVAAMALKQGRWQGVEIWRDDPESESAFDNILVVGGHSIRLRGTGNGRSVFAYRSTAVGWLDFQAPLHDSTQQSDWPNVRSDR